MALSSNSRVVALKHHASCELEGEAVILDLNNSVYYGLNEVALAIWDLIQEPVKVSEICDEIVRRFDVDQPECESGVIALLCGLQEASLLAVVDGHRNNAGSS